MCAFFALCGCQKKKTVHNTAFLGEDYAIDFPDNWEVKSKENKYADVIGISPKEDVQDLFRENVNVVLENIPTSMTDAEYLKHSLSNANEILGLPAEKEFSPLKVGKYPGYHIQYSTQVDQIEAGCDIYIVLHERSAYVITFSYAKGKRDAYIPTVDSIIESFVIK